jgi:hypothetical protein
MHKLPPPAHRRKTHLTSGAQLFVLLLLAMVCSCPSTEVASGCVERTVDGQCINWGFSINVRPKPNIASPTDQERHACVTALRQAASLGFDITAVRESLCKKFDLAPILPGPPRPIPPPVPEPPTDPPQE